MKKTIRPVIFKWRQTEPELILCAVRWYLRYSLSFRDVEELLDEARPYDKSDYCSSKTITTTRYCAARRA